jgi:hypothetical protein
MAYEQIVDQAAMEEMLASLYKSGERCAVHTLVGVFKVHIGLTENLETFFGHMNDSESRVSTVRLFELESITYPVNSRKERSGECILHVGMLPEFPPSWSISVKARG